MDAYRRSVAAESFLDSLCLVSFRFARACVAVRGRLTEVWSPWAWEALRDSRLTDSSAANESRAEPRIGSQKDRDESSILDLPRSILPRSILDLLPKVLAQLLSRLSRLGDVFRSSVDLVRGVVGFQLLSPLNHLLGSAFPRSLTLPLTRHRCFRSMGDSSASLCVAVS
jgi:hypothetical protein